MHQNCRLFGRRQLSSNYYAGSKYTSLIKFSVIQQKLWALENFPDFQNTP